MIYVYNKSRIMIKNLNKTHSKYILENFITLSLYSLIEHELF